MPGTLPEVQHIIFCEAVRPEGGGKASILGFFGIAPDVDILVPNLPAVIKLSVMLLCGSGDGRNHEGRAAVIGPDNREIASASMPNLQFPEHDRALIVVEFSGLQFSVPGKYTFTVFLESTELVSSTFQLTRNADLYRAVFSPQ